MWMWKYKVELPSPVMTVEDIVDLLVGILDEDTAREVVEAFEAYWQPARIPEEDTLCEDRID